jgi:hypothetical protein
MAASISDALWSCYLHGYAPGLTLKLTENPPGARPGAEKLEVIPLTDALESLIRDDSEHRQRNLQRALQQLAKGGFFGIESPSLSGSEHAELAGPLRQLFDATGLPVDVRAELDAAPQQTAPSIVNSAIDVQELSGPCAITNRTCVSCYNGITGTTTVTAKGTVSRPISTMTTVMDPQNWDHCSEAFLQTTPVVEVPEGGSLAGYYDPVEKVSGEPWSGLLYEQVEAGPQTYENVLWVTYVHHPQISQPVFLRIDYSLKDGYKPNLGGLMVDDGYILATRHPDDPGNKTDVEIVKTVLFQDFTPGGGPWDIGDLPNFYAPAVLCLWMDDQLYNGPCCTPP